MKTATLTLALFLTQPLYAQKAAVTDLPADPGTTIQVTKGTTTDRDYDILTGNAEIAGDPNVLANGARTSWKKACADWKTEIKDLNKENQLIALNCNSPKCTTEANNTTCASSGTYQVRVKIRK